MNIIARLSLTLWMVVGFTAHATTTTEYSYDVLGRIVQAVRSDGTVLQYQYDDNGNVVAINRLASSTVSVAGMSPQLGHVGATVTIYGSGFSEVASNNVVTFGTANATPTSATSTQLIVTVPQGAVTAPISVAVNGVSASSAESYVVRFPQIASFSPAVAQAGTPVTVLGSNLNLVPGNTIQVGTASTTPTYLHNSKVVFNAPASGSGVIRLNASYGSAASASSLIIAPPSVGAANIVSAKALATDGVEQTLNVDQSGKHGVFTFDAEQDQFLSLQISSVTPSNVNISYWLYSPSNALLVSGAVSGSRKTIHLPKIPLSGTYLITFRYPSGPFQLTAALEPDVELPVGGVSLQQSTSVASQSKRLWFTAAAGDDIALATTNMVLTPAVSSVRFTVIRPDGVVLAADNCFLTEQPGCALNMRDVPLGGVYTIMAEPNERIAMSFTLTLSTHISGTLALGVPTNLNLAVSGQHAWLTFTATAGQTMALNASAIAASPANKAVKLTVFGPTGAQVGVTMGNGIAYQTVNLPNLAAGTYSVLVNAADAATATMQLLLAPGMAGTLPIDGTSHSFASTVIHQLGYFTFEGTAGQNVGLGITDLAISQGWVILILDIFKPDGRGFAHLSCNPSELPGCQASLLNLPATGTYRIEASLRHVSGIAEATMAFTLTLSEHIQANLALDSPQSLNLAVPGQYALLSFTATEGQSLVLSANTIVTTPSGKAVQLRVVNPSGGAVGSASGTSSASVNLVSLPAGLYTVHINATNAATATMQVVLQ